MEVDSVKKLNELLNILGDKKVYIQTHNFPDPDAIGAAYGLQQLLKQYGIEADILYYGKIMKSNLIQMITSLNIIVHSVDDYPTNESDYVITIDGQKQNTNFNDIPGVEIACIDHHQWSSDYKYAFVDHRITGSCCSIIYDYYHDLKLDIPSNVATALLYGLKMDTNRFTRGVTEDDIEAFGSLFRKADQNLISKYDFNDKNITDLKIFGETMRTVEQFDNIGLARITSECPDGLIGEISDFLLSVDSIEIALIYAIRESGVKISIRSEIPEINAGKLIIKALEGIGEGGGHSSMAGGFIPAPKSKEIGSTLHAELKSRFVNAINEMKQE